MSDLSIVFAYTKVVEMFSELVQEMFIKVPVAVHKLQMLFDTF